MNHLEHIAAHLDELDAMLLTGEANCYYAAGFMGEGIALVTRRGSWYFTDSRYTEAADKAIGDAAVIREVSRERPFSALINEALAASGAEKVGFEDQRMTVAEHAVYSEKLHCTLTPASSLMTELRGSKDEEELSCMTAAQRIAEGALEQILKEIRPGMTEKEIAARLNYLMVSAGAEKTAFDTIVASGGMTFRAELPSIWVKATVVRSRAFISPPEVLPSRSRTQPKHHRLAKIIRYRKVE